MAVLQKSKREIRKVCPFDRPSSDPAGRAYTRYLDYKDYPTLKPYIDYFGNIRNRYYTGVCLKHQKMLKNAVERARFLGMLAYRK